MPKDFEQRIECLEKQVNDIQERQSCLCWLFGRDINARETFTSMMMDITTDELLDFMRRAVRKSDSSEA